MLPRPPSKSNMYANLLSLSNFSSKSKKESFERHSALMKHLERFSSQRPYGLSGHLFNRLKHFPSSILIKMGIYFSADKVKTWSTKLLTVARPGKMVKWGKC